jgi:hypothetical protein
MGEEDRMERDYLAGSRLLSGCSRFAQWFFRKSADLFGKLLWRGLSPRTLSAFLAATILSNALVLFLLHREVAAWGILLRGAGLMAAGVGLFGPADWRSVWESSFLMRLMGRSNGR